MTLQKDVESIGCDDSGLCFELAGMKSKAPFHIIYEGHPASRVLCESDNFAVLSDLAPLVEGHLLIVPKQHLKSFRSLPLDQWGELLAIKAKTRRIVTAFYAPPIVLEHGTGAGEASRTCVEHAHWHVIPVDVDVNVALAQAGAIPIEIDSEVEIRDFAEPSQAYYYFQTHDLHRRVYVAGVNGLPRQFNRKVIAEALTLSDTAWDWGVPPSKHLLQATVDRLQEPFRQLH